MPPKLAPLSNIWRRAREIAASDSLLRGTFFLLRALRDPRSVEAWLLFLSAFERTHGLAPASLEIITKPLGNYAVHRLSSERVALLRSNYSLAAMTLPANALSTVWSGSSIEVGYLQGKGGQRYRLTLDPARHCYKEGKFSFTLADAADDLELARLTFLLRTLSGGGERALLIGGSARPVFPLWRRRQSSHRGGNTGFIRAQTENGRLRWRLGFCDSDGLVISARRFQSD